MVVQDYEHGHVPHLPLLLLHGRQKAIYTPLLHRHLP